MRKSTILLLGTAFGAVAGGIFYHKTYSTHQSPQSMWKEKPLGDSKSIKSLAIEQSASMIQNFDPVKNLTSVYLNGFHPLRSKPEHQVCCFFFFSIIFRDDDSNLITFKIFLSQTMM